MPLYYQICLNSACLQCQYCQYSSAQSTANPGTLLTDYSTDSPDERVNSVETAHSDRKDRALSDEAYPEERSHGQSYNELTVTYTIRLTHCIIDGEDSGAAEAPKLCI